MATDSKLGTAGAGCAAAGCDAGLLKKSVTACLIRVKAVGANNGAWVIAVMVNTF